MQLLLLLIGDAHATHARKIRAGDQTARTVAVVEKSAASIAAAVEIVVEINSAAAVLNSDAVVVIAVIVVWLVAVALRAVCAFVHQRAFSEVAQLNR